MFAVIKTGGKQYCVKPGNILKVEKLDIEQNATVSINEVLMTSDDKGKIVVGTPVVIGAFVNAEVIKHTRNDKVIVFKKKRRHNYRRKNGHRQWMTVLNYPFREKDREYEPHRACANLSNKIVLIPEKNLWFVLVHKVLLIPAREKSCFNF
jgi:large subunit ribosomal protein L21